MVTEHVAAITAIEDRVADRYRMLAEQSDRIRFRDHAAWWLTEQVAELDWTTRKSHES